MKYIFFVILYSLFSSLYAQTIPAPNHSPRNPYEAEVIDSVIIRIKYAFNADNITDQETYLDLQQLEIGSKYSKYYSYFAFLSDSLVTDFVKNNPRTDGIPGRMGPLDGTWLEYIASEYFKDFDKNTLLEYTRSPRMAKEIFNVYSMENLPVQDWQIENDTLTIIGYLCQKASCHFRGRDYIAWFTPDIPINNGPWKFGNLPGLILKVYDTDSLYVFEGIGMEVFTHKIPMTKHNSYNNYTKADRKKRLKLQRDLNEDFLTTVGGTVGSGTVLSRGKHHPLELE